MTLEITPTAIPDVLIIKPKVYEDERGFFFESYNQSIFRQQTGIQEEFVQDNHSGSEKNVLRGLHYQMKHAQGKLVRIINGVIFDVAVDLRKNSPSFGKWVGITLSAEEKKLLWIPKGFAHGFLTLSDFAEVLYKATDYYDPSSERCLRWDDPEVAIKWPLSEQPILSKKDQQGKTFRDIRSDFTTN